MVSVERPEVRKTGARNGDCDLPFFESLHQLLQQLVPEYCATRGIDFTELSEVEQGKLSYELFVRFERREWRIYSIRRQQAQLERRSNDQVQINIRRKVEIKVSEREEPVILVPQTERMLAYFVALTEAKVWRGQEPLISGDQLAKVVDVYTLDQLRDHLLTPLTESGILEVDSSKRGYRLLADPGDLWEILHGTDYSYKIKVEGYDSWLAKRYPGVVLVGSHLEKMLKAIQFQAGASLSDDDLFDLERIARQTNLGHDRVYENLQELERLGIICRRRVGQYRMTDIIDRKFLKEIVRRQETPIVIRVNPSDSFAAILTVDRQEKFSFPQVSWEDGKGFEELSREQKLQLLEKVLTAHLKPEVYEVAGSKYAIRIPEVEDIPRELIFGILQNLGIGPKELGILSPVGTDSLAATIRRFEARVNSQTLAPNYGLLMEQIKVNLLQLVFEQEVFGKDSHNWSFPKVMEFLDSPPPLKKEAA